MTNSTRDILRAVSIVFGSMLFAVLAVPWIYELLTWYFSAVNGVFK